MIERVVIVVLLAGVAAAAMLLLRRPAGLDERRALAAAAVAPLPVFVFLLEATARSLSRGSSIGFATPTAWALVVGLAGVPFGIAAIHRSSAAISPWKLGALANIGRLVAAACWVIGVAILATTILYT